MGIGRARAFVLQVLVNAGWVLLILLLASVALAQEATSSNSRDLELDPQVLTSGTLLYHPADDENIDAVFSYGDSLVEFNATLQTPVLAKLRLEVNGLPLDATYDAASRTGSWNGHNGALFAEEREALTALSYELDGEFGGALKLLPHEHLLYRAVMYWAEAPVGLVLGHHEIPAPDERFTDSPSTAESDVPAVEDCLEVRASLDPELNPEQVPALENINTNTVDQISGEGQDSTDVGGAALAGSCQRADDDGIVHFTNCSSSAQADLYHDAKGSHCFLVQRDRNVGPCTKNCKGRCGPGCGAGAPDGGYTRDCAEHDQCCRIHGGCGNPWDGQCGDEFFDADDDYFNSRKTCDGCGNPH
jgi:hypothetical protein